NHERHIRNFRAKTNMLDSGEISKGREVIDSSICRSVSRQGGEYDKLGEIKTRMMRERIPEYVKVLKVLYVIPNERLRNPVKVCRRVIFYHDLQDSSHRFFCFAKKI